MTNTRDDGAFPLLTDYDTLERRSRLNLEIPDQITDNLSDKMTLRSYQLKAIARFRDYMEDEEVRAVPVQLLFEMATGSGKTAVMASLILDLYCRGYRNFLFFVNSNQIVEKTKANFTEPLSSKHLFAEEIVIGDARVAIRSVSNFSEADPTAINIHFTSIQGLHARMLRPRENEMTAEDFDDNRVVLISDEAHHMSADTKVFDKLSSSEKEARLSWEGTVNEIMNRNSENILLEFTATADLKNPAIRAKYSNRLIYNYDFRAFRADGYSKDIELRQASLPPEDRMLQAVILSQYRRKIAENHRIHCKPVILMKSRKIVESRENEALFHKTIEQLDGKQILKLQTASVNDPTMNAAFGLVLEDRGMDPDDFAQELKLEFAPERVVNVNQPKDLEARQILLNTLEDRDNEFRVIFAVDRLNEGWDVLNLFDIVRLYDTRDGKGDKVGNTTVSESQLIGRGARYFPFVCPEDEDLPVDRRKFDSDAENPLRILEQLHYHCSHNPRYIDDIKKALKSSGVIDDTVRKVTLRVKDSFKATEFYRSGHVWVNERIKNSRVSIKRLADYMPDRNLTFSNFASGRIIQVGAFGGGQSVDTGAGNQTTRLMTIEELGIEPIRFAMDGMPFYQFNALKELFPRLESRHEFVASPDYLSGITLTLRGRKSRLETLSAKDRLDIARFVLRGVEAAVKDKSVDYLGTIEFRPRLIQDAVIDTTLKIGIQGESGLSWTQSQIEGLHAIDLSAEEWHVFDDSYGTDQEKFLIRFIHDHRDQLLDRFDAFYLVRNERMVTIYSFDEGRAFEPDFILFLQEKCAEFMTTVQVFIEPKGKKLMPDERWKEKFLSQLSHRFELATLFQGKEYAIKGLPFYNSSGTAAPSFKQCFDGLFEF